MNLDTALKQRRLSGLAGTFSLRLQETGANRLSHAEFLELILSDELNLREQRRLNRRTQATEFHALKSLEDFDWRFNPSISRKLIYDLAAGHFVRQATDVLFVGPPGVGKTHLAQAIKQGFLVRYRSIFDLVADFLS
ncbi:MAG: ATP-binding protein [Candidatus Synoicihabitans palmerolidicus]|nr:ATP-binding protein [Candidatus Synoicihabitans palmerolidicus]